MKKKKKQKEKSFKEMYKNISPYLRPFLYKNFALGILLTIVSLIVTIEFRSPEFLVLALLGIFFWGRAIYIMMLYYEENGLLEFQGVCVDVYMPQYKNTLKNTVTYGRPYIVLENETSNKFLQVFVTKNFRCETGNTVIVFARPYACVQETEDSFILNSTIEVSVVSKNI